MSQPSLSLSKTMQASSRRTRVSPGCAGAPRCVRFAVIIRSGTAGPWRPKATRMASEAVDAASSGSDA
eukprot:3123525-Prymnesium_polylepis.2